MACSLRKVSLQHISAQRVKPVVCAIPRQPYARSQLNSKSVFDPSARSVVAASNTTQTVETSVTITDVNQGEFYDVIAAAGDSLVVVEFYSASCVKCKALFPELVKMAEQMPDVKFFKFICNSANKELGVKLKIKAVPTFHLYKKNELVADMTGAKIEKIQAFIEQHK